MILFLAVNIGAAVVLVGFGVVGPGTAGCGGGDALNDVTENAKFRRTSTE